MTQRKLVFLDIDGTLTSAPNHVPRSAVAACRAARANGHLLYIATGRCRAQIAPSVEAVGFDGLICSGGAYIEINGELVFSSFLPMQTLDRLTAWFGERGAGFSLELPEQVLASAGFLSPALPAPLLRVFQKSLAPLNDCFDRDRVCKMVFIESKAASFAEVLAEFGADCEIFRLSIPLPGMSGGEISAKGVHKGAAAAWVARRCGIEQEHTIAFGDSDNDRTLLEYAGAGIAMGNGDEALKQAADDVAGHARRGGLAKAFGKYGLV
jgi:Cof subfamily protein (haloacid dehalogenase superfamily)